MRRELWVPASSLVSMFARLVWRVRRINLVFVVRGAVSYTACTRQIVQRSTLSRHHPAGTLRCRNWMQEPPFAGLHRQTAGPQMISYDTDFCLDSCCYSFVSSNAGRPTASICSLHATEVAGFCPRGTFATPILIRQVAGKFATMFSGTINRYCAGLPQFRSWSHRWRSPTLHSIRRSAFSAAVPLE